MLISSKMIRFLKNASLVRKMFEEGIKLKSEHGKDQVFDYSLGNPDLSPPESFTREIRTASLDTTPGVHGYMPNGGWPDVRKAVAQHLTGEYPEIGRPFLASDVIMTVGAAGALNCVLKALLDPGDEVITLSPCFMEYLFYVDNHGGILRLAQTDRHFRPVPENVDALINEKTRVLLINTPNNPTGAVYTDTELKVLGELLTEANKKLPRPIFIVSDEPYRKIVFGGSTAPSVFAAYPYTIVVTSFSKDLSIPGERLGYAAVSPQACEDGELSDALTLCNRILGSVNAPSLMQRAVKGCLGDTADVAVYERRSRFLSDALSALGYVLTKPQGTFYLFPESPIPDDLAFTEILRGELVLAVPGSGFARPGYFRLSLCLDEAMIRRSVPAFARALGKAGSL
jgi:aspartate aminotransferase